MLNNTFINTVNLFLIMSSSVVLSSAFVANCLWKPMMRRIRRREDWEATQRGIMGSSMWNYDFFKRYPLETDITHEDKKNYMKTYRPSINFIVSETTPYGLVYMGHDDDGFIYWSDRSVPHKTLDVIARKYCVNSSRPQLYVNADVEETTDNPEKTTQTDSIFVKPKTSIQGKPSLKISEKDLNTKNYYRHRGKIQDYHTKKTTPAKKETSKMSFAEWQKMRAAQFKKEA